MSNYKKNIFCFIMPILILFIYSIKNNCDATIYQEVGFASSPNPVGSGARATGMGGAFIGIADDATSASWNPAGLIQLESPEISVVGAYLNRRDIFSSEGYPEMNNTGKVDDVNINYLSATYPFQFYRNMVVSINYQRLYEFKRKFDYQFELSFPGGKILQIKHFDQKGYVGALGLAWAIEIVPTFSLGTSLNIWTDKLLWENGWEEILALRDIGLEGSVSGTVDTIYTHKYSKFCGFNTNLGLLWNMSKYITFGIVIKTPFDASIHHKFSYIRTEDNIPVPTPPSTDEDVKLRMPLSYGSGLALRVSDSISFDLDVYRTEWSDFVLIDSQGNRFSPVDGRPESSSLLKDTTQVHFGGEYLFISKKRNLVIPLRAGIFYDPETSYNELRRFYGAAIGSGIAYKRIIFDMAYQLRWGRNIDTGNLIATSRSKIIQHLFLTSLIIHF